MCELSISIELYNHLDSTASIVSSNPIVRALGTLFALNRLGINTCYRQMTDFIIFVVSKDTVLLLKATVQSCMPDDQVEIHQSSLNKILRKTGASASKKMECI